MNNKGLIATIVVLVAVIITLITVVFLMQMPTIFSLNTLKNQATETTVIESVTEPSTETQVKETIKAAPKISTSLETYTGYNNHVSINYPQINGMDDEEQQGKLNNKIKTNAISIVKLYPISTAIQYLDVDCEVKSINDKYITIVYEGKVVGKSIKDGTNKNSSSSTNQSASNNYYNPNIVLPDPYLDGFIDPLAIYGVNNQVPAAQIPAPAQNTYSQNNTLNSDTEVIPAGQNNVIKNKSDNGTVDGGPKVVDIKAPTAASRERTPEIVVDNYSSNYPGTQNSSNVPVYGFTGTNMRNDASTINQKIFYANTIDLKTGLDVTLQDYVSDLNALAKYTRSSKVEFVNVADKNKKEVREYINKTVPSKLEEEFKNADFRNEGVSTWPKVFSYKEKDGTVCFSVKLSSKLGNYAIVKYKE